MGRRSALLYPQKEDAMNHTLHHLRWLLCRFRWALAGYAVLWAAFTVCVWLLPATPDSWKLFISGAGGLMLFGAFLLLDVVWQDQAPGTDTFWRTRPPRWYSVWVSQLLCGLLICLPPAVCWMVNGLMLLNTGAQWRQTVPDLLYPAVFVLAAAGLGSFARRWVAYALTLLLATGCWIGGRELFLWAHRKGAGSLRTSTVSLETVWLISMLILLTVVLLSWAAGMRRAGVWRRGAAAILTGLAAPFIAFHLAPPSRDETILLHLVVADAEAKRSPGAQPAGDLVLHGVPENSVAVIEWSNVGVAATVDGPGLVWDSDHPIPRKSNDWHLSNHSADFPGGLPELARCDATEVTGELIRGLLPAGVRWYKNRTASGSFRNLPAPAFQLRNREDESVLPPLWLKGDTRGLLLSVRPLMRVPLTAGAAGAGSGGRVRLDRFGYDGPSLSFTAGLWLAANGSSAVPPAGRMISGFFDETAVPVIYLPALSMAVLITGGTNSGGGMRPWQCTARIVSATFVMPAAESAPGMIFSPETLRGAELLLFAPVITGNFRVRLPEGPQRFPARDSEYSSAALDRSFRRFSDPARGAGVSELNERAEFMRRLLITPRGYRHGARYFVDGKAVEWWHWLSEEHVPDLIAAVRRDPEWMDCAWMTPLEPKLRPVALDLVRSTVHPLPASVVASAAAIAAPQDYARLRHHALLAKWGVQWPGRYAELYRRLRALPGFDWKQLARTHFMAIQTPAVEHDNSHHTAFYRQPDPAGPIVATFAALAGDIVALSRVVDGHGRESLLANEREELFALIEGLPPSGPERDSWLTANSSFLEWDESKGRYRIRQ